MRTVMNTKSAILFGKLSKKKKKIEEGKTMDSDLQRVIHAEMKKWRDTFTFLFKERESEKVIADVILFCARNNLVLRCITEVIGQQNSGIFLNLIELISNYYPLVAEHIASFKAKKTITSYFSPRIQNELIKLLGQKENFVDFIECHQIIGKSLATEITEKVRERRSKNCRGQGFVNGANMSGKYNCVQAHIHSFCELARFFYCAAHTLDLADAAETAKQNGIEGDFSVKRRQKLKRIALYEDNFHLFTTETEFRSQCNLVFDSIVTQIK
ncbi:uncharacterized protein LOC136095143 [Hydra vulgaris]|uniref:uncharacterized protein LOC136095143 n=1 Tax=Hydra vulgaris TaxID=6087 RepID=UPI0032EA4046